jgi:hypothetical protein
MVSRGVEAVGLAIDRFAAAADYLVDLVTAYDPVEMTLHERMGRVQAAVITLEGVIFDKAYDITNKGRNN